LTTKEYSLGGEEAGDIAIPSTIDDDGKKKSKVRYEVLVDTCDAYISHNSDPVALEEEDDLVSDLGSISELSFRYSNIVVERDVDLIPVNDPWCVDEKEARCPKFFTRVGSHVRCFLSFDFARSPLVPSLYPQWTPSLQRIYSVFINSYFARFSGGHYVPNRLISYVYPLDMYSECDGHGGIVKGGTDAVESGQPSSKLLRSRSDIADGMRYISGRLVSSLSYEPMAGQQQKMAIRQDISRLISSLRSSAESIATGVDAPPNPNRDLFVSIANLHAFHVRVNSMLWTRRASRRDKPNINFSLGQVVRHKIYGFRGLVAAWDSKPRMDVSNWDGLSHIERPQEKPFYHIYPDANDCVIAFGGPRGFRYVCQDNLEICPIDDPLEFATTLDPDEWKWDSDGGSYTPSMEMKVSSRRILISSLIRWLYLT
jgi:hemimethylated DNA binding protein